MYINVLLYTVLHREHKKIYVSRSDVGGSFTDDEGAATAE